MTDELTQLVTVTSPPLPIGWVAPIVILVLPLGKVFQPNPEVIKEIGRTVRHIVTSIKEVLLALITYCRLRPQGKKKGRK